MSVDLDIFRTYADSYESIQKVRIAVENRLRAMEQGFDEFDPEREFILERIAKLIEEEEAYQRRMLLKLEAMPLYNDFLVNVKGIAMTLACKLVALKLNPDLNFGSWLAYFGLSALYWKGICEKNHKRFYTKDPLVCKFETKKGTEYIKCGKGIVEKELIPEAPKRTIGWQGFENPRARKLYWNVVTSFLKAKGYYAELYYKFKDIELEKYFRPEVSLSEYHKHEANNKKIAKVKEEIAKLEKDKKGEPAKIKEAIEKLLEELSELPEKFNLSSLLIGYDDKDKNGKSKPFSINGISLLQIHRRASRKTMQMFLSNMYQAVNELLGRTLLLASQKPKLGVKYYRPPYAFEYLNHPNTSLIHWKEIVIYEKAKKAA